MALAFSILSPLAEAATGEARQLTAPGTEGEFGILQNHAPFASLLKPGCLVVEKMDGAKEYFYVRGGFLRASADEVVVLADEVQKSTALDETEIDQVIRDSQDDVANIKDEEKRDEAKQRLKEYQAKRLVIENARA